jgi:hypothetical protein
MDGPLPQENNITCCLFQLPHPSIPPDTEHAKTLNLNHALPCPGQSLPEKSFRNRHRQLLPCSRLLAVACHTTTPPSPPFLLKSSHIHIMANAIASPTSYNKYMFFCFFLLSYKQSSSCSPCLCYTHQFSLVDMLLCLWYTHTR